MKLMLQRLLIAVLWVGMFCTICIALALFIAIITG